MVGLIRRLFQPKLAEYIPGERRVYKNILGRTVKTIERSEKTIENLQTGK